MAGKIRSREKYCPNCKDASERPLKLTILPDEKGIICPGCDYRPKTYFIDLYWQGRNRIARDRDNYILDSFARAKRLLDNIRGDIDANLFSLQNYLPKEVEAFRPKKLFPKWMDSKTWIAPSTLREYRRYVTLYFLPFFKDRDLRNLKTGAIEDFFMALPEMQRKYGRRPLSLKTQQNISIALHAFCAWLHRREVIARVPLFPKISPPKPPIDWITRDEQIKILAFIDPHHRPIFEFMFLHPIRIGEARALRVKHFRPETGCVDIVEAFSLKEIRSRKNKSPYTLALARSYNLNCLRGKLPEAFAFINKAGRPYTSEGLRKIWDRARKRAGYRIALKNATRHSGASQSLNAGVSLVIISKALGHSSTKITQDRYASMNIELTRAVVDRDLMQTTTQLGQMAGNSKNDNSAK